MNDRYQPEQEVCSECNTMNVKMCIMPVSFTFDLSRHNRNRLPCDFKDFVDMTQKDVKDSQTYTFDDIT